MRDKTLAGCDSTTVVADMMVWTVGRSGGEVPGGGSEEWGAVLTQGGASACA